MKKKLVYVLAVSAAMWATPLGARAEEEPTDDTTAQEQETLPEAQIASMGTVYGNARVAIDYQGPHSEKPLAIVGSLQRLSRERCSARVANTSQDATYQVRYEVMRYHFHEEATTALERRTTLAPAQEETREFDCEKSNAAIFLRGGSLVSRAAKKNEAEK